MYSLGINKFTPPHGVISAKKTLLCGLRTAFLCIFHKQSYTNKYIIEMSNRIYRSIPIGAILHYTLLKLTKNTINV